MWMVNPPGLRGGAPQAAKAAMSGSGEGGGRERRRGGCRGGGGGGGVGKDLDETEGQWQRQFRGRQGGTGEIDCQADRAEIAGQANWLGWRWRGRIWEINRRCLDS